MKAKEVEASSRPDGVSAPYRFCYIAPDVPIPSPRGSSVHVREVAKALTSRGRELFIICRRTGRGEAKNEYFDGISLHRIYRFMVSPGRKVSGVVGKSAAETQSGLPSILYGIYLRSLFSLYVAIVGARVIRKNKIDAVIERETSFGAGALASILTGKPMILEIVGPRYSRISVWRSKKILYYTDSMLRRWVKRSKCIEVSGGVNTSLFHEDRKAGEDLRKRLGFNTEHRVIGYVGTFQDWHGIDTLLFAILDLKALCKNIRAVLIGPFYEKYKRLSKDLGLDDVCTFTGPVEYEHVSAYINACDIMVALYEPARNSLRKQYGIGSPLKILEYMACDKPVISTRVSPVDKVVQQGSSGYLVTPGDKNELIDAISRLLDDDSMINLFTKNGRRLVEEQFSWGAVADVIDNLLTERKH